MNIENTTGVGKRTPPAPQKGAVSERLIELKQAPDEVSLKEENAPSPKVLQPGKKLQAMKDQLSFSKSLVKDLPKDDEACFHRLIGKMEGKQVSSGSTLGELLLSANERKSVEGQIKIALFVHLMQSRLRAPLDEKVFETCADPACSLGTLTTALRASRHAYSAEEEAARNEARMTLKERSVGNG